MRPARKALRPATTAARLASAIMRGSRAPAIAGVLDTPSPPGPRATAAAAAGADGLVGRVAAGRVGQERVAAAVDRVEHVGLARRQVDAAERDRDDLGARAQDGLAAELDRRVLARAHEEARLEALAADHQR